MALWMDIGIFGIGMLMLRTILPDAVLYSSMFLFLDWLDELLIPRAPIDDKKRHEIAEGRFVCM